MSPTPSRMFASSSTMRIFSFMFASCDGRKEKLEGRAHADLALDVHAPFVAVDHLAHDGQAQAGAARLRREERREDLVEHVRRDAGARVADIDLHPAGLRDARA